MFEKIHIIIPLIAGIIITIVSWVQKVGITMMCIRLIATIILFYILGIIIRTKLQKMFDDGLCDDLEIYDANEENEETSNEDTSETNI
jgi:hypothetical protein